MTSYQFYWEKDSLEFGKKRQLGVWHKARSNPWKRHLLFHRTTEQLLAFGSTLSLDERTKGLCASNAYDKESCVDSNLDFLIYIRFR